MKDSDGQLAEDIARECGQTELAKQLNEWRTAGYKQAPPAAKKPTAVEVVDVAGGGPCACLFGGKRAKDKYKVTQVAPDA